MPTKTVEAAVPEPPWSTKVLRGPQELTGGPRGGIVWTLLGALVALGLIGVRCCTDERTSSIRCVKSATEFDGGGLIGAAGGMANHDTPRRASAL
jgi:hypothetical protein